MVIIHCGFFRWRKTTSKYTRHSLYSSARVINKRSDSIPGLAYGMIRNRNPLNVTVLRKVKIKSSRYMWWIEKSRKSKPKSLFSYNVWTVSSWLLSPWRGHRFLSDCTLLVKCAPITFCVQALISDQSLKMCRYFWKFYLLFLMRTSYRIRTFDTRYCRYCLSLSTRVESLTDVHPDSCQIGMNGIAVKLVFSCS